MLKIDTSYIVPIAAVLASILLLVAGKQRVFEILALIASVVWLLLDLGLFNWPLHNKFGSPGIVLGALMLVSGVIVYLNTDNKREVTASTVLSILGGIMLFGALRALG
jgi:hypothetical protein